MIAKYTRLGFVLCVLALAASGCTQPLTQQEKRALLGTGAGIATGAIVSGGSSTGALTGAVLGGLTGIVSERLLNAWDGNPQREQEKELEALRRDNERQRWQLEHMQRDDEPFDEYAPRVPRSSLRSEELGRK